MKLIYTLFFSLVIVTTCLAQVTPGETMTLAIQYGRGEAGNYPRSLFVSGITSEDDTKTIWGVKPSALFEGAKGDVRVYSNDGHKVTLIRKTYATLAEAERDRNEMIAAMKKMYPAIAAQPAGANTNTTLIEEKAYADETRGVFACILQIFKQPDAEANARYQLLVLL